MAEQPEEQKQEELRSVAELTTEIVVAYLIRNTISVADLGNLIDVVAHAFEALGRQDIEPATANPKPAVPVRCSIGEDYVVCLVCGKQLRIVRRHLEVRHQLTPEAYRELFGLRSNYPMVAPGYARQRSEMARRFGLANHVQA